jgi:hypothetical protein
VALTGDDRPTAAAPSWAKVIATTMRLWWRRRFGRSTQGRAAGKRAGLVVLLLALLAASATAVDLALSRPGTNSGRPAQARGSPAASTARALTAASASRQQAAAWVVAQVGHDVIVACDPLMCSALQQHGFPTACLAPIALGAGDPLGSGIVVSTAAVRSQLGPRLTSVYAPQVIASFGTGQSLVQILVTAPGGAAAYKTSEIADISARKAGGADLLRNGNINVSHAAITELDAGQVDTRLLITLAALAHRYPLDIRGFSDAGPGSAPGTPLRSVAVSTASAADLSGMLGFLRAQQAPLLAQTAERSAGQTTVLQIQFTAPSPLGLLS